MFGQQSPSSPATLFEPIVDRLLTMVEVTNRLRDAYVDEITDLQSAIQEVLFALKGTLEEGSGQTVTDSLQIALTRLNHAQSLHDAVMDDAIRHYQALESLQVLLWNTVPKSTSEWATPSP
jgi:hypothetical protein